LEDLLAQQNEDQEKQGIQQKSTTNFNTTNLLIDCIS